MNDNEQLFDFYSVLHKNTNKFEFKLSKKNSIYIPLFFSSIEHCISIGLLNKEYLTSSMYALVRPSIENYLRAMWVQYVASDSEIPDDLSTMHFPKKPEYMIEKVDEKVPDLKK